MEKKPDSVQKVVEIVSNFRKTKNIDDFLKRINFNIPLVDLQMDIDELKLITPFLKSINFTEMMESPTKSLITQTYPITTNLTFWGNYLDSSIFESNIRNFLALQTLTISWVSCEWRLNLSLFQHLRKVKLTCFSSSHDIDLSECHNLESFKMKHPKKFGNKIIFHDCENLGKFKIVSVPIKSIDITGCKKLKQIYLSLGYLETPLMLTDCLNLESLTISYMNEKSLFIVDGNIIFPQLRHLILTGNQFNQDLMLSSFSNLEQIDLEGCENFNTPLNFDNNPKLIQIFLQNCLNFNKPIDVSCCHDLLVLDTKRTQIPSIKFHPTQQLDKIWNHYSKLFQQVESLFQTNDNKIIIQYS